MSSLSGVWLRLVVPVFLFVWSVAVRAVGAPALLEGKEGAYFFGNDAYYHARRIWYTVVNFPEFLTRDAYINFPHGAQPIWSPTFDWLAAVVVRVALGPADQQGMERLLVWIPPVLGGLSVVVLYLLALRVFSRRVALVSGLLLSIMQGHFWYSQFGFLDHHAAVALMTTWLLAATMGLFSQDTDSAKLRAPALRAALGLGVASGSALLIWPGCLIHVAIVDVALVVHLLTAKNAREAITRARLYALASAVACAIVFPFSWWNDWDRWGDLSPLVLSHFQPFWLAGAALCFAAVGEVWRRRSFPAPLTDRVLQVVLVGGVVAGLLLSFVPVLSGGLGDSWEWFAKAETFQSSVGESKSLFADGGTRPEQVFTRALYLAPVLLTLLLVFAWRRPRRERDQLLFFVWWCLMLGAITLMQRRFMNSSSVCWSMLLAWGICGGLRLVRDLLRRRTGGEGFAFVALAALVLGVYSLIPVAKAYRPYMDNLARVLDGKPSLVIHEVERRQVMREAMSNWLRANTPPTAGWLDASATPQYAVLGPWSGGHVIKYVAKRPVIVDNFGDDVGRENFLAARSYYGSLTEDEALARLDGLGVRYVIAREDHAARTGSGNPRTMMSRLSRFRGSKGLLGASGQEEPEIQLDALKHHRLIYSSGPISSEASTRVPYFRIFEIVTGARVSGIAPPGARIMARLAVTSLSYPPFHYVATARADNSGRYELVLPYSSKSPSSIVEVAEAYEIGIGKIKTNLRVPEKAVTKGLFVAGPNFQSERKTDGDDDRKANRGARRKADRAERAERKADGKQKE